MKKISKILLGASVALMLTGSNLLASEGSDKFVPIKSGVKSVEISLNGEKFTIMRNQTAGNKISKLYEATNRGTPQPMIISEGVETVGEVEFVEFMQKAQYDKNIKIIDSRKPGWFARLRIPGTTNVPFTDFNNLDDATDWLVDEFGVKQNDNGTLDFSNAKTLVLYCNGYWCGQTPGMVKNSKHSLLKLGYPASKIKYYRGGMQAWTSLGFTVVGDEANK